MKCGIILFFLIYGCLAFGNDGESAKENWVLVGDMYVPESAVVPRDLGVRGFKQKNVRLWAGGILRYQFASEMSQQRRSEFLRYCQEMGEFADIQCLPRRAQDRDYVYVKKTNSGPCGSTYLGRYGGRQPLNVMCWRRRTIQHELMHAFGISHEHNRMDRDNYITIVWDNIQSNFRYAYNKVALGGISHRLNYYDFDSIMHYGSGSGAKFGRAAFYINELGPQSGQMKQTTRMSFGDHYILYALYGGERPH